MLERKTRSVDQVINTTKTPINVYAIDGEIIYLTPSCAFTGPRSGVLFIVEELQREDNIIAKSVGQGRGGIYVWELYDKEGVRIYPRRG